MDESITLKQFEEEYDYDCSVCPFHDDVCPGGWKSGYGGVPIEPPCTGWDKYDDDTTLDEIYDDYESAQRAWERRLKEYYDNIERDFQEEWSKKHFKWFFTKRRQKKLRDKITHRYAGPVFWLIEEIIEDTLPKMVDENFQKFVDIKDFALGDKAYFTEEEHDDKN